MSDFLFAPPSFWEGVARILDFGETLTELNRSSTGAQADRIALEQDWLMVGDDLRSALGQFKESASNDCVADRV